MGKYICMAILALLITGSGYALYKTGVKERELSERIDKLNNLADPKEEIPALKSDLNSMDGERILIGITLAFLSAGLAGIVFISEVLPRLAQKMSATIYDGNDEIEADSFRDARVLMAQGHWEEAVEAFAMGAEKDPLNRMPWVEIAKIQRQHLENPALAVKTLREAIEGHEWEVSDGAFLMFRLAEIYEEDFENHETAASIMKQIIEQFPETRHSATANAKLREWGLA